MPDKPSPLNVQFNPKQAAALSAMAAELGTTKTNVIRLALTLFLFAQREKKAGNSIGVVRGDVVLREVVGL